MLNADLETAMNEQVGAEFYSSHLYLAMSAWCETVNLPGAANWFRLQADEEREHGLRFVTHILDRGGKVSLGAIAAPPADFGTLLSAFEAALDHERSVTARINSLYTTAVTQGDYASQGFLQWFVQEQVEEEKQADEIVQTLRAVADDPSTLYLFDRELGGRRAEEGE